MMVLQISNEAVIGVSFVVAFIIAAIISLIVYVALRRSINSFRSQFNNIPAQFQQITSDMNNLKLGLPHYEEVADVKKQLSTMLDEQKNFVGSVSTTLDLFKRTHSEEMEKIRKDMINVAEQKSEEIAKNHIELMSVSREEFERLRERIEKLLGPEELAERLDVLGSLFDSKNIKALVWQCKLIRLLENGLAPEVEEDVIVGAGIPLTSYKTFLKKLQQKNLIELKSVDAYNIVPEFAWIYSYVDNPDWLQKRLENYIKKEEEYQKYIRENIHLIEEQLIVVAEQYEVDSGRIDILCRDRSGRDCGVELKYPAATTEVIGQLLRYKEDYSRMAGNNSMRYILVAPKISDKVQQLLSKNNMECRQISF